MSPYSTEKLPHIEHHDSDQHARRCWYCGKGFDGKAHQRKPSWDHLLPQSLGGPSIPGNLVMSCKGCNEEKGSLPLPLYRMLCGLNFIRSRPDLYDQPYRHVFFGERDKDLPNEFMLGDIEIPRSSYVYL